MQKYRVLVDMDGVMADFQGGRTNNKTERNPPEMYKYGFFENLPVIPGALENIQKLHQHPWITLEIVTKPVATAPHTYTEKVRWVAKHFPYLVDKITLTQDKQYTKGDFLIDDTKCPGFSGDFITFYTDIDPVIMWENTVLYITKDIEQLAEKEQFAKALVHKQNGDNRDGFWSGGSNEE